MVGVYYYYVCDLVYSAKHELVPGTVFKCHIVVSDISIDSSNCIIFVRDLMWDLMCVVAADEDEGCIPELM